MDVKAAEYLRKKFNKTYESIKKIFTLLKTKGLAMISDTKRAFEDRENTPLNLKDLNNFPLKNFKAKVGNAD